MNRQIILESKIIKYTLKRSKRAKRIRLTIKQDASVFVTIPYYLSSKIAENFLYEKRKWIINKLRLAEREKICLDNTINLSYKASRIKAQELAETRVSHFSKKYGVEYNRIVIKNHKNIWGSCSSKKNLNFNYRIILLSPDLVDYIIVHEICHLLELNHSRKFWELVEREIEDYKEKRKQLRKFYF